MSRAERHEKWKTILSELVDSLATAKQILHDYDGTKPTGLERHSSWHWTRKDLAGDVSSLRQTIEIAEMEVKFYEPATKKLTTASENVDRPEQFKISTLLQSDPARLTEAERAVRSCLIRSQEKLRKSGLRNDPPDRPNQSGGYQVDKGL